MQPTRLTILFLLCCCSCKNKQRLHAEHFDKTLWAIKVDMNYPYRSSMLNDLLASYKKPGSNKDSVFHLLGAPDRTDNGYFFYTVSRQGLGVFTLHATTLVVKLGPDSSVMWFKLHE